jgi:death on curing protein
MSLRILKKTDIVHINKRTILAHGGNFVEPCNFLHEDNLDYLVEIVSSEMFGFELYPLISDKAALYAFNIICNHIFTDGNKRTGLEAGLVFLKLNGYRLNQVLPNKELFEFIISIAEGKTNLEECKNWFKKNMVSLE